MRRLRPTDWTEGVLASSQHIDPEAWRAYCTAMHAARAAYERAPAKSIDAVIEYGLARDGALRAYTKALVARGWSACGAPA